MAGASCGRPRLRRLAASPVLALTVVASLAHEASGKVGCTDVLDGCCLPASDCDLIPYMNAMSGLQCLSPTPAQCHEMQVGCMCPVNGAAIDSWESPCTPEPENSYLYDHLTRRCLTCDQYLAQLPVAAADPSAPTAVEQTGPYSAGDFACRLGGPDGDRVEIDCVSGDVGAVSLVACPYAVVPAPPPPTVPEPEPEVVPDCGPHGLFSDGSCACETGVDPTTGETLKCWQTNRERSNRHPNGNIKEWCTIGMCNFDEAGRAVLASGAQASATPSAALDVVADLAKALGVSPGVVYGAGGLFIIVSCWLMCSGESSDKNVARNHRRSGRESEMTDDMLISVAGRAAEMHNPIGPRSSQVQEGGARPQRQPAPPPASIPRGRARQPTDIEV